jgi:hypothetical protein
MTRRSDRFTAVAVRHANRIEKLEREVDAAYEADDFDRAEDLDAKLADLREREPEPVEAADE